MRLFYGCSRSLDVLLQGVKRRFGLRTFQAQFRSFLNKSTVSFTSCLGEKCSLRLIPLNLQRCR